MEAERTLLSARGLAVFDAGLIQFVAEFARTAVEQVGVEIGCFGTQLNGSGSEFIRPDGRSGRAEARW